MCVLRSLFVNIGSILSVAWHVFVLDFVQIIGRILLQSYFMYLLFLASTDMFKKVWLHERTYIVKY